MLIFILPAKADFIYMFSKDESKRPKATSPPLVTWKFVQQKMPWGLMLLLGGGFTIAEGAKESGMSTMIADHLSSIANLNKNYILIITCFVAVGLTQVASNVAVANVILPVVAEISVVSNEWTKFTYRQVGGTILFDQLLIIRIICRFYAVVLVVKSVFLPWCWYSRILRIRLS